MRKVRYSVAMSLDGFIAGPHGENDWIVMDPEIDFRSLFSGFDTVLLGRRTWETTRQQSGGGEMPGIRSWVFSRTLRQEDCPGVTVSDDPAAVIGGLKAASGKDIWLFGGSSLFGSLLQMGLVDSIEAMVIPVLLGGGVPFLPAAVSFKKLRLESHRIYSQTGTVSLKYSVV